MEKALIEKMNKDMTEIKNLWKKVIEDNGCEKVSEKTDSGKSLFPEKIKDYAQVYKDFGTFFAEYNMGIVTHEDFIKVRNTINKLYKEVKKEIFDKSAVENTINEFQEIRITGSGKLSEEIVKKSGEDFKKLEEIIKNKDWEKETEFIHERYSHYNKIKEWYDGNILRDLELYSSIFDTMVNFDISVKQMAKNKEPYIFVSED